MENKNVTGKVLLGITVPELYIFDTFEDYEYQRSTVEIDLKVSSTANIFVAPYTLNMLFLARLHKENREKT